MKTIGWAAGGLAAAVLLAAAGWGMLHPAGGPVTAKPPGTPPTASPTG